MLMGVAAGLVGVADAGPMFKSKPACFYKNDKNGS